MVQNYKVMVILTLGGGEGFGSLGIQYIHFHESHDFMHYLTFVKWVYDRVTETEINMTLQ